MQDKVPGPGLGLGIGAVPLLLSLPVGVNGGVGEVKERCGG